MKKYCKCNTSLTKICFVCVCRLEKRNMERLKQKKLHAATKQARRVDFD